MEKLVSYEDVHLVFHTPGARQPLLSIRTKGVCPESVRRSACRVRSG
ncbi:hypothetical protein HJ590_14375 [Naumannella sp. ID2617S]|nr:hypothetical protein [Naumannella sp. ID2617S]